MQRFIFLAMLAAIMISTGTAHADNKKAVQLCLKSWGTHPFNASNPKYRVIGKKVKVFGIGGNVNDKESTRYPELVLVKPNVNVMSLSRMYLMNPNGWYCIHNKVNVLSKTIIHLHCDARLATTKEGMAILAKDDKEEGLTILGKATVMRECPEKEQPVNTSAKPLPGSNSSSSNHHHHKISQVDRKVAMSAQEALNNRGFNAGTADGLWGGKSRTALKEFQKTNGLTASGELDAASLSALGVNKNSSNSQNAQLDEREKSVDEAPLAAEDFSSASDSAAEPFSEKPISSSVEKQDVGEKTATMMRTMKVNNKVNFYSDQDPFSEVISIIPARSSFDVIAENSEWLTVKYNGKNGYISKDEVK